MPAPLCLAMVICDAVWRDPATGKFTILGTFSAVQGAAFPLIIQQITVYCSLTDARGKVPIKVVLIDADEERGPIATMETEVEFPDPIVVLDLVTALQGINFPAAGEYRLQLYGSGEFVMERRIVVLSAERAEPNE